MSFPPPTVANGLLCLIALIVFGIATGLGLLFLFRVPADPRSRVLLAPIVATMFWAIAGGVLVRAGLTMAQVALPMWGCSAALALFGLWASLRARAATADSGSIVLAIGVTAATIVCMAPAIARGLFSTLGPSNPDAYLYTTLAAGYWEHGLNYDDASLFFERLGGYLGLSAFRNHTFVLLAFFSRLVEAGEPAFVRNLFICWSLFILGMGAAYHYRMAPRRDAATVPTALLYVWLVMGLGWAFVPAAVGNWDNGLFVAIVPVLAAMSFAAGGWRWAIVLGAAVAYAFLTYPELTPTAAVVVAPYFVLRLVREPRSRRAVLIHYGVAAAVACVLIIPAAPDLSAYVFRQLRAAVTEMRPGGAFADGLLLQWWNPSAWWGLGPEYGAVSGWRDFIPACLLSLATVAGAVQAIRRWREPRGWALLMVLASLVYFIAVERYSYAAYKILSVTWWLIALLLLDGWLALWSALRQSKPHPWVLRGTAAAAVVLIVMTSVVSVEHRGRRFFADWVDQALPRLDVLMELRDQARQRPPGTALVTGSLASDLGLPWVLYALRSTPVEVYVAEPTQFPFGDGFTWTKTTAPDSALSSTGDGPLHGRLLIATRRFTLTDYGPP